MEISKSKNDKCVCCGCDTQIPKATPLSKRRYYVYGGGQLCADCYKKLYICQSESGGKLSFEEMKYLLEMCEKSNNGKCD